MASDGAGAADAGAGGDGATDAGADGAGADGAGTDHAGADGAGAFNRFQSGNEPLPKRSDKELRRNITRRSLLAVDREIQSPHLRTREFPRNAFQHATKRRFA